MFKLILILSTVSTNAVVDVNGGDIRTPGGFYFSTFETCKKAGDNWHAAGEMSDDNYKYVCLDVSGQ